MLQLLKHDFYTQLTIRTYSTETHKGKEGGKIIGIYAGGSHFSCEKKNEGATTFHEEKNDRANAFF